MYILSRFIKHRDYVSCPYGHDEDLHVIYGELAEYPDHQIRIPRTQLQFWHSIRGIHQRMCICSDTVWDLMRLFETQNSLSTFEEGKREV